MNLFSPILIVNLILLTTIPIRQSEARCAMRSPCALQRHLNDYDEPTSSKWYNCRYDGEPQPLNSQEAVDDFKKLCSSMYTDDSQPLCCNGEQLSILKKDLLTAQALIGSCSSCYFNFRQLWCQFACSPSQADFIVPYNITSLPGSNFTQRMEIYKKQKEKIANDDWDYGDEEDYDDEYDNYEIYGAEGSDDGDSMDYVKEETMEEKPNLTTPQSHENNTTPVLQNTTPVLDGDNAEETEAYDDNAEEETTVRRKKRSATKSKKIESSNVDAVIGVNYFIDRTFMEEFVDSCRDIKIYGDDALQGLCGLPAPKCNGQELGDFLGLKVNLRPMDINFRLRDEKTLKHTQLDPITKKETTYAVKTAKPHFHACNESFQYGSLEYGAKCSCRDCKSSCILYDDLKIAKKQVFMIGDLDGVSLIMFILFVLFMVPFLKSISLFSYLRDAICKKEKSGLNCNIYKGQTQSSGANGELENNLLPHMSPMSHEDYDTSVKNRKSQMNVFDRMTYVGDLLEKFIEKKFTQMGRFCATYPGLVLFIGIAFCGVLCLGYVNFKIENDPIKLWSADSSIARQNKKYFDEQFSPFYRITQLIIEPKASVKPQLFDGNIMNITALNAQLLNETLNLYMRIKGLRGVCRDCEMDKNMKISLEDICYQPLKPSNKKCAVQSLFQYWKNDEKRIRDAIKSNRHLHYLKNCMTNPYNPACLADFGGPIQPYMVAGSYDDENFMESQSLVITFVLNNYIKAKNPENIKKAMAWEFEVLNLLKNYSSPLIDVSYTTERSIEDELERESKADMKIIGISYVIMFLYLTLTLGKYSSSNIRMILVEMKIFLALSGVILVMLSVLSSGGFFTYVGVPATLITLEVVPFLLLAVGVDNIYVMVQTYQNDERHESETVVEQIARIVGKVGPSMLLTGTTQAASFLISAMTPMPGVRAFSLYASLAIVLNFILQITCFVALLSIDAKREKSKRVDMLCCIKCRNLDEEDINSGKKSFLHIWFKEIYTPFLFNNCVRATVIVTFIGFFFACIAMCDKITIGLDQKLTMSKDSYQNKYFSAIQKHLKVGPPVYFVLKNGYNYTDVNSLRMLCGASNCDPDSLQSIISSASFFPSETYIAQSPVNWIDDYMEWLNSDPTGETSSTCCFINSKTKEFCDVKRLRNLDKQNKKEQEFLNDCVPCPINRTSFEFPTNDVVLRHIQDYLKQNPSETCIKAGHAMYGDAVNLQFNEDSTEVERIGSSHFMAYHTVLSTSDDFINAMVSANQISAKITDELNKRTSRTDGQKFEVVPYSIFYVFYEQYVNIWQDATAQLVTTLLAIFICTFILLSFDLFTSLIVTIVVAIVIIDMVGVMFLWNIELNAISLVNLVIAIGISVEFSAHIGRSFAISNSKTKKKRASDALYNMGPPVFCGGLQSILGISVLAFAHSQLFQVFYFRMYLAILILGLSHGLIFLPVLLSYIGRSSSHLQFLKVNFDKNSSTESYEIVQEMNMCVKTENNHRELTPTEYGKKLCSPGASPSRKLYSKIALSDRDSPTSRKSVDCLLNDEVNSTSSIENVKKETNIDDVNNNSSFKNSNQNLYTEIPSEFNSSFASKLTSLRNKLNGSRNSKNGSISDRDVPQTPCQSNVQQKDYEISTPNIPTQEETLSNYKDNENDRTDELSQSLNLTPSKPDVQKDNNNVGKSLSNVVINGGPQKISSS